MKGTCYAALAAASVFLAGPASARGHGGFGGGVHGGGFHGGGSHGGYHAPAYHAPAYHAPAYHAPTYHPSGGYRPAAVSNYHGSTSGLARPAAGSFHNGNGAAAVHNSFNAGAGHGGPRTIANGARGGYAHPGNFAHANGFANHGVTTHVSNFTTINRTTNINPGWHQDYWNGRWNGFGGHWGGHGWAGWPGYGYGYGYGGGFWPGFGLGLGAGIGAGMLGWGLASWGLGAWPYSYGYASYVNPYYVAAPAVIGVPVYNYAQPIPVGGPAPAQPAVDTGATSFDAARAAFQAGDFPAALQQADQAIVSLPNDVDLHEFRAVTLFALGRFDEASAAMYAVLTAGPGWNWATLVGLYPNVDTFTAQLRTLEQACNDHPDQASLRFLLAYFYLTMGSNDAAAGQLRLVVRLQPGDRLSAQLLGQLSGTPEATPSPMPSPLPSPSDPQASPPAPLPSVMPGPWKATGADNAAVGLDLRPDGTFTWSATIQGTTRTFQGRYSLGNGLMTLARDDGPPIVGRVEGAGDNGFRFLLAGSASNDPGLTFRR